MKNTSIATKITKLKGFLEGVFQIKKITWEKKHEDMKEKDIRRNVKYTDMLLSVGPTSTDFFIKVFVPRYSLIKEGKYILIHLHAVAICIFHILRALSNILSQ